MQNKVDKLSRTSDNMKNRLAVLQNHSETQSAALPEGDTLARLGGDEFVAIIVDLEQPQDVYPTLKRLPQAASQAVLIPVQPDLAGPVVKLSLRVSASLGVTFYPQDDLDADVLVRHADQAMYQAKWRSGAPMG